MREHRSLGPKLPRIRLSSCRGRRRKPPLDGSPVGGRHHLLEHDHWVGQAAATSRSTSSSTVVRSRSSVSRKSPCPPLNSGWGKHDAGSGADATTTIDDESHCHVTPALMRLLDRLRLGCHAEFGQQSGASSSVAPWSTDPEVIAQCATSGSAKPTTPSPRVELRNLKTDQLGQLDVHPRQTTSS